MKWHTGFDKISNHRTKEVELITQGRITETRHNLRFLTFIFYSEFCNVCFVHLVIYKLYNGRTSMIQM